MNFISRLLRKNTPPARIIGFVHSNSIRLALVIGGLQFYLDARSIWEADDSFIRSDYLVINKRVTSGNTLGGADGFSPEEIAEINAQPWVRKSAPFTSSDFMVRAALQQGGRGMSTSMFFEAIPDEFVDVPKSQWSWQEGAHEVPLIISKDYLTLYNFGFASAAGLPQMSEGFMSGIPLTLTLSSDDSDRRITLHGRVAGYSNRLNTILVPQNFIDWCNSRLGSHTDRFPSRFIIDVNSPGDVAISKFMEEHDYEIAGDKSAASASFLLKLVVGIVLAIGGVITLLSLFILMLSVSLLMEKNRDKLHSLLMLGYPLSQVGAPYRAIIFRASLSAGVLAFAATLLMRTAYLEQLKDLGAETTSIYTALLVDIVLTALIILFNILAVNRKVKASWRLKN